MVLDITQSDISFIESALDGKVNSIYQFEGYVIGTICSNEKISQNALLSRLFGSQNSNADIQRIVDIFNKIYYRACSQLENRCYSPILSSTNSLIKEYAFGFLQSYRIQQVSKSGNYNAKVAYMVISLIYSPKKKLNDPSYIELIKRLDEIPVLIVSKAIQVLDRYRRVTELTTESLKDNVINFV